MMDMWRWIMINVFRRKYVILTDFEGDTRIRKVWFRNGNAYASWFFPSHGVTDVRLQDNGYIFGSWVRTWENYKPFQPKKLPKGMA